MKKIKLFAFCLGIFWLSSCKDDEKPIPNNPTAIVVEIVGLEDGDVVWNEVPLTFEINDEVSIEKIEIYLNGNLITILQEAPFKFNWNTKDLEDGEHAVKVITFDATGNKTEIIRNVKVKNTLLTLKVDKNYLAQNGHSGERGFIFISDEAGKTVFFEEYFNGSEIKIKRPSDFASREFMFTNFTEQDYLYENRPMVYIESYFLNETDEWNLKSPDEEDPNNEIEIGTASLRFTNYSEYESIFISDFYSTHTMYDLSSEASFSLYQPSTNIFLALQGAQDKKFKFVKDLKSGEQREVDLSVTEQNSVKLVTNSYSTHGLTSFSWELSGYYGDHIDKDLPLSSDYTTSENLKFVYPEGVFQKFRTDFWGINDQVEYYTAIVGEIPDAVEFIDVDYTFISSKTTDFKASISGDWDFFSLWWENLNYDDASVAIEWTVHAGKDQLSFKLPEIPSKINEIYPGIDISKSDLEEIVVTDADEIDGYNGFIAAASQADLEIKRGKYKIAWFDNQSDRENNGRKKFSPKKLKSLIPYTKH